jgi:hypothetical protein
MAVQRGEGLRVRLRPVSDVTPREVLAAPFYFPAVLGDFQWEESASHEEYQTVSAGEFSAAAPGTSKARLLRPLSLEVFASAQPLPFLVDGSADFMEVRKLLIAILRSRKPVNLMASMRLDETPEVHMHVTVRRVSATLRHAQANVRYFDVELMEWRDNAVGTRQASKPASANARKHALKAKDTAESLSRTYYRTYAGAEGILRANGIAKWGKRTPIVDHARFKVDDQIVIPKLKTQRVGPNGTVGVGSTGAKSKPSGDVVVDQVQ